MLIPHFSGVSRDVCFVPLVCDTRVAKLGEKAPIWLLLAAVRALKFGFGALLATLWATF